MPALHIHVYTQDAHWVTMHGTHVFIGDDGKVTKGPAALVEHHTSSKGTKYKVSTARSESGAYRAHVTSQEQTVYMGGKAHEHEEAALAEGRRKIVGKPKLAAGSQTNAGEIFSHKPMNFPKYVEHERGHGAAPEASVNVHLMVPTQETVGNANVRKYRTGNGAYQNDVPEVVKLKNGRYAVVDGHHRAAAGIMDGKENMRVRVVGEEDA